MSETCNSDEKRINYIEFGWQNMLVSSHLEDRGNWRITIIWILVNRLGSWQEEGLIQDLVQWETSVSAVLNLPESLAVCVEYMMHNVALGQLFSSNVPNHLPSRHYRRMVVWPIWGPKCYTNGFHPTTLSINLGDLFLIEYVIEMILN
jgi:hypothetical protein